jgi:hypothetical protein
MPGLRSACALSLGVALLGCCWDVGLWCADADPAPQSESDTIRGTVLNSLTHGPVGRALVYSSDNRFATLTDSAGHFEFKVPVSKAERKSEGPVEVTQEGPVVVSGEGLFPQTALVLMARKPGFLSEETSVAPFRGLGGTLNAPTAPVSPGQKEVMIYLVPGALIVGHVTVTDSDSAQRVQVEIYRRQIQDGRARWTSAGRLTTWSDGQFRFSELYPGTYKLFTHELMDRDPLTSNPRGPLYGYPPVYFPGANNFAVGSAIQLRAGVTFNADLSPSRRKYYPVDIAVANVAEGEPVGVDVSAGGREGPGYSLGYNPRVQKIQGWLPDGTYTVKVSTYGPASEPGSAEISVQGAAATGYTMTLIPGASIRVNVAEEFTSTEGSGAQEGSAGGPARYVQVSLEPADEFEQRGHFGGVSSRQPGAAENELLTLEHVKPGRYWVRVNSGRGFAASIKCGDTDLLHHPLLVPPGGLRDPIELALRDDGAQVDGLIVESVPTIPGTQPSPAAPTAYIYLIPSPDSTGQFKEVGASPDGRFSLQQIPPGDYQVLAFDREQTELEYRNEGAMRKYESLGQDVRLVPGQDAHLQLHLITGSE